MCIQVYDVDVESSYWPAGEGEDVFPNSPAHKICTKLVLWSDEAAVLLETSMI